MDVSASDPLLSEWPRGFEWVTASTLEAMLPTVDYLSVHVPLTAGTRGLIGAQAIGALRRDAVLIHCARGGVVDEQALFEALDTNALRGAVLDVFESEPPGAIPLLSLPNVIATPHLGASTAEAQVRAGVEVADQVIEALSRLTVQP